MFTEADRPTMRVFPHRFDSRVSLARFGAILTDRGGIFRDEFDQIIEKLLVALSNLLLFEKILDLAHEILWEPTASLLYRLT